jgi:hypothetical protein
LESGDLVLEGDIMNTEEAECIQSAEERGSKRNDLHAGLGELSWPKICQLRKLIPRRLTLAPNVEQGNSTDQVKVETAQVEGDASSLDQERARDGSMELMNFTLECACGGSSWSTATDLEEEGWLG